MSRDLPKGFADAVTAQSSTALYPVGTRRFEGGTEYVYTQADDAITQYQAVKIDFAASTTGKKVTPTAAVTDNLFGVAQIAVTDEYYFWCAVRGPATCKIATAASAGDLLAPTATAGVLAVCANTDVAMIRGVACEAGAATNAAKAIVLL